MVGRLLGQRRAESKREEDPQNLCIGELLRDHYQELADELVQLRDARDLEREQEERRARIERVFSDKDPELDDLDADEPLDPDRGYSTGDPVADRWEREWAMGKIPDIDD